MKKNGYRCRGGEKGRQPEAVKGLTAGEKEVQVFGGGWKGGHIPESAPYS